MKPRDRWLLVASVALLVYSGCGAWDAQTESLELNERLSKERGEIENLDNILRGAHLKLAGSPMVPISDSPTAIQLLRKAAELGVTVERIAAVGNGYRLTVSGTLEHVLAMSGGSATEVSLSRRADPDNRFEATMTLSPGTGTAIPATPDGIRSALRRPRIPEPAQASGVTDTAADGRIAALFQATGIPSIAVTAPPVTSVPVLREQIPTEPPFDFLGQIQTGSHPMTGVLKSRSTGVIASVARGGRFEDWTLVALSAETATLRSGSGTNLTLSRHH